jgi:antitoxin component of MazEF toxin-antitoxin module
MKIQKRFLRKYKDKDYYKYIVNLPPLVLKEAGIKYGEEVEINVENGKIILEKKGKKKQTDKKN